MKVSVSGGDLCDVPAEALCTSTNPRLSLLMGTGAAIRRRGGYQILRACEQIVASLSSDAHGLPAGSAHVTTAGDLPAKIIIHCVASDARHHSSPDIIAMCVASALARADAAQCRSIAMPLFGTGHARLDIASALGAMAGAIRQATTALEHIYIAVNDPDLVEKAAGLLRCAMPGQTIDIRQGAVPLLDESPGRWSDRWLGEDD